MEYFPINYFEYFSNKSLNHWNMFKYFLAHFLIGALIVTRQQLSFI